LFETGSTTSLVKVGGTKTFQDWCGMRMQLTDGTVLEWGGGDIQTTEMPSTYTGFGDTVHLVLGNKHMRNYVFDFEMRESRLTVYGEYK